MTRNTPHTRSKTPAPAGPIEPIVITTDEEADESRIDVFSIDGRMYTMPSHIPASMSLRVLDAIRRQGQEAAISWVLEEVLGEDAYEALLDCPSLKPDQLKAVMAVVQNHVIGAMEDTPGN